MKTKCIKKVGIMFLFGMIAFIGTTNFASAQNRWHKQNNNRIQRDHNRNQQNRRNQDQSALSQPIYQQQKAQNQQRYDQRKQVYQDNQNQTKNNQQRSNDLQNTIQQNPQYQYGQRQIRPGENRRIQSTQNDWIKSEKNWKNQYDSKWRQAQSRFDQRSKRLRQNNRTNQYAFQQSYWDRVREDHDRLQNWNSVNNAVINYSYLRGGQFYYTSQYGMNLLREAVGDGYQEGYLAGQADRSDRYGYDIVDAFAYQDASYGYNGYWVDLGEYQYYFREGFQKGYDDGFYNRHRFGAFTNGNYLLNTGVLDGLINFTFIDR